MTKEDAIHFANCLKNNYTIDFNDMADFCDMVIEALERKPCEDCVSRAEVIDELNHLGRNAFKNDTDYDNFFAFVDSLPPITPTRKVGKWMVKDNGNGGMYVECPFCGALAPCTEFADRVVWKYSNFCYDCGNDMRGNKDENN